MNPPQARAEQCDLEPPTGWARAKLGDIYELAYGKSLTKATRNKGGKYPVYGSNGIVGRHDTFLVEGPVLIVGRKGAAGTVSFSAKPCWPIDTTYYVRDSNHMDIRFSFYLFKSLRLNQFDRSTAIPGLNRYDAYNLRVRVPPLPEQRRIVAKIEELFSELDKGIENLKTARAKLNVYRQAVLKHAFEGKLTAQWREKNKDKLETPEQLLARIKQERETRYEQQLNEWKAAVKTWEENGKPGKRPHAPKRPLEVTGISDDVGERLPLLPVGWLWVHLGNISHVSGGITKHQKRNSLPRKMKYLRVANVYADKIFTDQVYKIGVTDEEAEKCSLNVGDLLIVEGNGSIEQVGRVAMWKGELADCGHQNHLIRVRLTTESFPRYVLQFLLSPLGRELIVNEASSTSGLHTLSISKVKNLIVPAVSYAEESAVIAQVDGKLSKIDELIEEIEKQLVKADALRQSVLKKAFTGQLVAQDPHDEPASILLDRIRAEREQAKKRTTRRKTGKRKTARTIA